MKKILLVFVAVLCFSLSNAIRVILQFTGDLTDETGKSPPMKHLLVQ